MIRYLILTALLVTSVQGAELQTLEHKVIYDERTYTRDNADRRYSVWTTDKISATKLLKDFGIQLPDFELHSGQVLAVFLNDNITEDLTQIIHNKSANHTFADYADSGIKFKLRALVDGKKYSHITAVVFTPVNMPNHLGIRGMIPGGLSEKL